jgi:hypothetical protein
MLVAFGAVANRLRRKQSQKQRLIGRPLRALTLENWSGTAMMAASGGMSSITTYRTSMRNGRRRC